MDQATYERVANALQLSGDMEHDLQAQVSLYFEAVRGKAQAQNEVDSLKHDLEFTEAAVYEGVRTAAIKSGEKVTEEGVKMRVRQDELYVTAQQLLLAAKRLAGEWNALADSFEQRGYALNNLTALATRGVGPGGISDYGQLRKSQAEARRPTQK